MKENAVVIARLLRLRRIPRHGGTRVRHVPPFGRRGRDGTTAFGKWAALGAVLILLLACGKVEDVTTPRPQQEAPPALGVTAHSAAAQPAHEDRPFGLRQGMTLAELAGTIGIDPAQAASVDAMQMIAATEVPEPSPDFERYMLYVNRKSGLCMVAAYGRELPLASERETLQQAYQRIADALKAKYGPPADESSGLMAATERAANLAMDNASHTGPAQSYMAWSTGRMSAGSLVRIDLAAVSEDWTSGGLLLMYSFANANTCRS